MRNLHFGVIFKMNVSLCFSRTCVLTRKRRHRLDVYMRNAVYSEKCLHELHISGTNIYSTCYTQEDCSP